MYAIDDIHDVADLDSEDDSQDEEITEVAAIVSQLNEISKNHLQSNKSRGSTAATRRSQWLPSETEDASFTLNYMEPETVDEFGLQDPVDYVKRFLSDDFLELFVDQCNLYAVQKNPNKPLGVNKDEFEQWIGLVYYFSISRLPNVRMHWSRQLPTMRETAARIMSRNRWQDIKSPLGRQC